MTWGVVVRAGGMTDHVEHDTSLDPLRVPGGDGVHGNDKRKHVGYCAGTSFT
jgi:hypothetical protein